MTAKELIAMVENGAIIECKTVFQRRNVLDFFDNYGLKIGIATQEHLEIEAEFDHDTEFMHPGFSARDMAICCYRVIPGGRASVQYMDIADIVENLCIPKIDERSETEFAEDFASLMC